MKRLLSLLFISVSLLPAAKSQPLLREWFTSMPDSVMPLLTHNDRLDFIDFCDAQMAAVVTNVMDGTSRMDTLTADYVHISYTPSTDVEMKLLPTSDTTHILCMVTTVKARVSDSRIAFYDAQWQPLDASALFAEPQMEDFRSATADDTAAQAWDKLDIYFRTYHLSPDEPSLRCVLTATDFLSEDDRAALAPLVSREPLQYHWVDGRFIVHHER